MVKRNRTLKPFIINIPRYTGDIYLYKNQPTEEKSLRWVFGFSLEFYNAVYYVIVGAVIVEFEVCFKVNCAVLYIVPGAVVVN